jgi:HD-GYP domain-containing protein (c-di-GMP phosphodiesterase class II)
MRSGRKPGPLGFGEWERVRLYPHFTERAFAQSPALAPIGLLAGSHHERLDGSGYQRGARGPALDQNARILAAADCYGAMREPRPYSWQRFATDPEVPPIMQEAGHKGRPQVAELAGRYDA